VLPITASVERLQSVVGKLESLAKIMEWSAHYRALGQPVRSARELLETVADKLGEKFHITRSSAPI
jgi:hypothetical protein